MATLLLTHTLPPTMQSIFPVKALAQNTLWIWPISIESDTLFLYDSITMFFNCLKVCRKDIPSSWSLSNSSQLPIMINPFCCSWDDSCTTLRQRQRTWTVYDPKACWCSLTAAMFRAHTWKVFELSLLFKNTQSHEKQHKVKGFILKNQW